MVGWKYIKKDGFMNMCMYNYAFENSHFIREERSQYWFKANIWTDILNGLVIDLLELPENLN